MMSINISHKAACVSIDGTVDKVESWKTVLETRHKDHLNRIGGFLVSLKSDDDIKYSISIFDCNKSKKRAILTITIFKTTGKITAQGQAYLKWHDNDLDVIHKKLQDHENYEENIEDFAKIFVSNAAARSFSVSDEALKLPLPDEDPCFKELLSPIFERLSKVEKDNEYLKMN